MSSATVNVSKAHFDGFNFVINEIKKQVVTDMCREYQLDFDEVMRKLDGECAIVPSKGNKSEFMGSSVEKQSPTDLTKKPRGRSPKGKKWVHGTGWVSNDDASSDEDHSDNEGSHAEKAAAKATKDAEKAAAKEAKDAEKAAAKATKDAEKAAAKATKDAEKAAAKATKDAEKAAAKEAKDAEKAAAKEAKDAEKAAAKATKDAEKAAAKATKDAEKAEKAAAKEARDAEKAATKDADEHSEDMDLIKKPRGRSPKGKVWQSGVGWVDTQSNIGDDDKELIQETSSPTNVLQEPIIMGDPINNEQHDGLVEEGEVEEDDEEEQHDRVVEEGEVEEEVEEDDEEEEDQVVMVYNEEEESDYEE